VSVSHCTSELKAKSDSGKTKLIKIDSRVAITLKEYVMPFTQIQLKKGKSP